MVAAEGADLAGGDRRVRRVGARPQAVLLAPSITAYTSVSLFGNSVSMSFATLMRCAFMSPRCGIPPFTIFSVPFGSVSMCGKSEKCVGQ